MIKLKDILSESNLTEAKFYVSYNPGRGMGKKVVNSPESDYEEPRVFRNYNDAEKYVKKVKSSGASPGRIISYWVSDINSNRIDRFGKILEDVSSQDYQRIEIVYTEPGQGNRFYGTYAYLDGKKSHDTKFNEQETNNYLESMGVTIKVPRRHDSNILDSIVKKLQAKGVDAGHGDYMDVS